MTQGVGREHRHLRAHPCPVCGGGEDMPRGQGKRCTGFTSADGKWVRCSRDELAGSLPPDDSCSPPVYRHLWGGACHCGVTHAPAPYRADSNQIEATYDYRDESGTLLYQVVRKVGKEFRQRRPDPTADGGWSWKLGDVRRVLYRLPELLAAPPDATVYVVEGEKDCESLARRGHIATCNPMGQGKTKWNAVVTLAQSALANRDVVVVADRDDETTTPPFAGQKHAKYVAETLGSVARSVRLLVPRPPHKDASDVLAAGGDLADLVPLAEKPAPPPRPTPDRPRPSGQWRGMLIHKTFKGKPTQAYKANVANAATILAHDDRWSGVLAYDEFAETIVASKPPPWRDWDSPDGGTVAGDWSDSDTTRLQTWLSTEFDIDVGAETALAAVQVAALRRRVHPIRDWLDSLRWDGKTRLPTWLIDVFGCEDTPYVRSVGQAWAVSAVARVYQPGCKVDTVLVLEGKPGTFKSSVLRKLVGDAYFLEMSITEVANKDAMQILRRKWIAEFPEIDGLSRSEQAHVKSFFSRQVDTYRASYGRGTKDYPRQTVFAATTNKNDYLTDETGGSGRRMWPVNCKLGDIHRAESIRDQFWAEARARFQSGELWHITDPEIIDAAREEQDARFRADPWEQTVAEWLASPADVGSKVADGVTTAQALAAVGLDPAKRDNGHSARIGAILRRLGWLPGKHTEERNGARVRRYRPVDGSATNGHTLMPIQEPPGAFLEREVTEDDFPDVASTVFD